MAHAVRQHSGRDLIGEHDAVRRAGHLRERQPGAAQAEPVAGRPEAQDSVDQAAWRHADAEAREQAQRPQRVGRDADPPGQVVDDPPFLARRAARLHDRLRDLHERRAEEAHQRDGTSSRSRNVVAGEHVVRVPARLGHVEVERHHQVELAERRLERVAVGDRQHRVARRHEEGADLPLARCRDLLGEQRRRQVADHVGEVAEPGAHLAVGGEPRLLARPRRARSAGGRTPRRPGGPGCR